MLGLRHSEDIRELFLSLDSFFPEYLMHVSPKDSKIIIVVDSATINCVLKDAVDFLPLNACCVSFILEIKDYGFSCLKITIRELIIFSPSLRNICPSFLDEGMEPRQNE